MDREIARCREMPAFKNVMNERFTGVDTVGMAERFINEMKDPQKQEKLWEDVIAQQQKALQAEADKPVQMPRQPQAEQDGPKVGQDGPQAGGAPVA